MDKHGITLYEQEYPYDTNSASGFEDGWSVEARHVYPEPKKVGEQVFDNRWRQVDFYPSHIGVPTGGYGNRFGHMAGLLSYEAAQALRWWFVAELRRDMLGGWCMETRIVKHEVKYSYSSKAVSAHDNLGGDLAQFSPDRPIDLQGNGRTVTTEKQKQ